MLFLGDRIERQLSSLHPACIAACCVCRLQQSREAAQLLVKGTLQQVEPVLARLAGQQPTIDSPDSGQDLTPTEMIPDEAIAQVRTTISLASVKHLPSANCLEPWQQGCQQLCILSMRLLWCIWQLFPV